MTIARFLGIVALILGIFAVWQGAILGGVVLLVVALLLLGVLQT